MKCDESLLERVLDEPTLEDEQLTEHLAQCPSCQAKMASLVADPATWSDWSAALLDRETQLESSVLVTLDTELASDLPLQADPISLSFLDPPSHPEMLGRIGRYEVERLVGAGGMGVVLKGYDTELHRTVAIKVLSPHLVHHGGARQRFAREAQSAASVVHEHVIPIHDVNVSGVHPYLVMQYVAGESLQGRVDRDGPLPMDEVLQIGIQVCSGLAAAHRHGLVHRDVKPANVLLESNVDRVLLSDFGLARAADDASLTRSGMISGTPHYMSPEQAQGLSVDCASDLFSLGCVLYFMVAGHPPFRASGAMAVLNRICLHPHRPVDEQRNQVPVALADLIDQLLSKDAKRRPKSADVVVQRLTQLLSDFRSSRRNLLSRRQRARRRMGALTVLCITALAGIGWIVNANGSRPSRESGRAVPSAILPSEGYTRGSTGEAYLGAATSSRTLLEPGSYTPDDRGSLYHESEESQLARFMDFTDEKMDASLAELVAGVDVLEQGDGDSSTIYPWHEIQTGLQNDSWSRGLETLKMEVREIDTERE